MVSFCLLQSWHTQEARRAQKSATRLVKSLGFIGKLSESKSPEERCEESEGSAGKVMAQMGRCGEAYLIGVGNILGIGQHQKLKLQIWNNSNGPTRKKRKNKQTAKKKNPTRLKKQGGTKCWPWQCIV